MNIQSQKRIIHNGVNFKEMPHSTTGHLVNEWMTVHCHKPERICLTTWCACEGMVLLKFTF